VARKRRIFREFQHPRDDRGRFARSGGSAWAKRAAEDFRQAEESAARATKPPVAGRPRIGRSAKAGAVINQHQAGAGDVLSRKWARPEKLPPGASRRTRTVQIEAGTDQILHDGEWRTVTGTGYGAEVGDYLMYRDEDGKRVTVPFPAEGVIARPAVVEFTEPLRGKQLARMAAWRVDTDETPQMRIRTNGEDADERGEKDLEIAKAALKEAQRKARARANRKYPNKEGYSKWTRDQYVDHETWREQSAVTMEDNYRVHRANLPPGGSSSYLDRPGSRLPVLTGPLNRDRPLSVYGDLLHIEDDDQATYRHLADLESVPAELHALVARAMFQARERWQDRTVGQSAGVWVGSRPTPDLDDMQDLAAVRPRGWEDGKTWSDVDGAYRANTRTMVAGASSASQHRGEHGQPALHEFGHALDHAVGTLLQQDDPNFPDRAASDPEWRKVHAQVVNAAPDINPYFKQAGQAGPVEMWAEAFGEWARARAKARQSDFFTDTLDDGREFLANRAERALSRQFRITDPDAERALNQYFEALMTRLGVDL
jgi:hypothetical protein